MKTLSPSVAKRWAKDDDGDDEPRKGKGADKPKSADDVLPGVQKQIASGNIDGAVEDALSDFDGEADEGQKPRMVKDAAKWEEAVEAVDPSSEEALELYGDIDAAYVCVGMVYKAMGGEFGDADGDEDEGEGEGEEEPDDADEGLEMGAD